MRFPIPIRQAAQLIHVSEYNMAGTWPLVEDALAAFGIVSPHAHVAAIATIRTETPPFIPIREYGDRQRIVNLYWNDQHKAAMLGNLSADDAWRYRGAGLIQITGRDNYEHYGKRIGVNLLDDPDEALEPHTAALLFADYFHDHNIHVLAVRRDWKAVRKAVNGGTNGWQTFITAVNTLEAELEKVNVVAACHRP